MKKSGLLFAFAMFLMSFGTVSAQKLATLDVAEILNLMPEKKKADQQLEAFSKTKQAEIEKQMTAAEAKFKKYQEEAAKQTPKVNEERNQELQKLQQNIQQMTQVAQQDLAKRQGEAYAPIEKKVNDAVAKVAKANGWDFVFDTNTVGLIYRGGADATAAVKKELGLK